MSENTKRSSYTESQDSVSIGKEYFDLIRTSQQQWRERKRGILSRPVEVPILASVVDSNFKRIFPGYIDPDYPTPLLAVSALVDTQNPEGGTIRFHHEVPSEIPDDQREDYKRGIYSLNEWATNKVALHTLEHLMRFTPYRKLARFYGDFHDQFQFYTYMPAYNVMEDIEDRNNKNRFDDAVFRAYFQGDTEELERMVKGYFGNRWPAVHTLSEFATYLGKQQQVKNLNEIVTPVLMEQEESVLKATAKRVMVSALISGMSSQPGVIEVVTASDIGIVAGGLTMGAAYSPAMSVATGALAAGMNSFRTPFMLAHEFAHEYSNGSSHSGLVPCRLVVVYE